MVDIRAPYMTVLEPLPSGLILAALLGCSLVLINTSLAVIAVATLILIVAYRSWNVKVTADAQGLVVRNRFRTFGLSWSNIDYFAYGHVRPNGPYGITVRPRGGRPRLIEATANRNDVARDRTMRELEDLLASQSGHDPA